jgi:hypothetical protein
MRFPFFDPRRDEVAAVATDLIIRFGLRAHAEASYLADLSLQMHSRRHRLLYELVALEIDASFDEAERRLGLRQGESDAAHPDGSFSANLKRRHLTVDQRAIVAA